MIDRLTSEQIRQARHRAGLPQRELAEQIGVTRVAVAQWESGVRVPSALACYALGQALGAEVKRGEVMTDESDELGTVAVHLSEAATLIERNGWVQNRYGPIGGAQCAEGAILTATAGSMYVRQFVLARDWLERCLGLGEDETLEGWNDTAGRLQGEVVAALRDAAGRASSASA